MLGLMNSYAESAQEDAKVDMSDGSWSVSLLRHHIDPKISQLTLSALDKAVLPIPYRISDIKNTPSDEISSRLKQTFDLIKKDWSRSRGGHTEPLQKGSITKPKRKKANQKK
jgi:hypothetical protein